MSNERTLDEMKAANARLRSLTNYWRRAAYGIHNESCDKPECMAQIEAAQPRHATEELRDELELTRKQQTELIQYFERKLEEVSDGLKAVIEQLESMLS